MSAILRFWFLLSSFNVNQKRNLYHFYPVLLDGSSAFSASLFTLCNRKFLLLNVSKGSYFFFCFCHYSFPKSHLIAFLFMIRRLPKSFLNFLLVTIENYFQRHCSIPQSLAAVSPFSLIFWVYRFYVRFSVYSDCSDKCSFQTTCFPRYRVYGEPMALLHPFGCWLNSLLRSTAK